MRKILGIGNALVDITTILEDDSTLQRFSLPKGSMQLVDKSKSEMIRSETAGLRRNLASGGSAANTIHGMAKLGIATAFTGSIGRDETGDFFENDMKQAGVRTRLYRRDSPTGTAVVLISRDFERTFATYLGAAVELNAADLDPSDFDGYDLLYLEGYLIYNRPLVERACEIAKEKGVKIALDLASYNVVEENLSAFREITDRYVDILFANEEEARAFTGKDPEEALHLLATASGIVIVKAGSKGSWIRSGDEILRIGTGEINVVDTTGAGDLYAAGFLYGYCTGSGLETCGVFGSIAAGKVIEVVGAKIEPDAWVEIKNSFSRMTGR